MKDVKRKVTGQGLFIKLLLFFGGSFTLIVVVIGTATVISTKKNIDHMIDNQLHRSMDLTYKIVETSIDSSIKSHLFTVADKSERILNHLYEEAQRGLITEDEAYMRAYRLMKSEEYSAIGKDGYLAWVDGNGVIRLHNSIKEGTDLSSYKFMQQAMSQRNGYLEYKWKNRGEKFERDKAAGLKYFAPWDIIVWASAYKSEFSYLIDHETLSRELLSVKTGETGMTFVIDGQGNFVLHESEPAGKSGLDIQGAGGRYYIKEIVEAVKEEQQSREYKVGKIYYYRKGKGGLLGGRQQKIAIYRYEPDLDWIIVTTSYFGDFYGDLYNMIRLIIIAVILSIIATLVIVFFIVSGITGAIGSIKRVTDQVIKGDLQAVIELERGDEIGELGGHFNHIVDKFRCLLLDLKGNSRLILDSVHSLSSSAKEISATSNQQAAAVKEIVSTMEDSNKLSRGIHEKTVEVTRIANHTKDEVQSGFSLLKDKLSKMDEIRETNFQTIQGIKSLGEQIDSIWEIVNIINSIADQTKIIAFNAELEASAAGEAGKNFEIVANEIRRLADNTVSSTKEIKLKINEIQRSSDNLVVASEEGTEKIKEGWDMSKQLEIIFSTILSSSEISASSSEQITGLINQQVLSFEQIFITLKQISEGIENFVISTQSTTQASESLKGMAEQLDGFIGDYKVAE